MYLAGQDEMERGYAMAALIVSMAVMAILMTAAMPVWKHMAQREKEEELVFRGEQYAHAIGMFQRRTANSYPPNLDVLVQQRFLRRKYKDPVTNDDFVPLAQSQQAGQRGAQPGPPGRGQPARGGPAGTAAPGQVAAVGGIIGVTSKSTAESIRLYKGRSHYNEWAFIYTPPAVVPGGAAGAATPGAGVPNPARGQGPRGNQPPGPFPGQGGGFPGRGGQGGPGRGNLPPGTRTPTDGRSTGR
jgi:type II secretory pathway pseudopilin PulG